MESRKQNAAFEEVKYNISHLRRWGCEMILFDNRIKEWEKFLDKDILSLIDSYNLTDNQVLKNLIIETYDALMGARKYKLAVIISEKFNL